MKPIKRYNRHFRAKHSNDAPSLSPVAHNLTFASFIGRQSLKLTALTKIMIILMLCCLLASCQLFVVPPKFAAASGLDSSLSFQTANLRTIAGKQQEDNYIRSILPGINGASNDADHLRPQLISRKVRQVTGNDPQQRRPSLVVDTRSPYHVTNNERESYYKDVSLGDEISIACFGQRPIRWTYPDSLSNSRRLQILHPPGGSGARGRIQSTLTVQDAQASDTGLYACFYSDSFDSEDSSAANDFLKVRVFIFVNDWQNLFVEPKNYIASRGAMITLSQGEPGIIPCVPTFSNATVTLVQVHHAGHEVQIPLQISDDGDSSGPASDFRYAPTRGGIIIPFPSKPMVGQHRCRAQVRDFNSNRPETEELNVRALNFIVQGKPPHPVIDRSRARHVIEGGSFSLSCYVNLPLTKEPITLEWTAPSRETQSRLRQTAVTTVTKRSSSLADLEYLEVRRNFTLNGVDRITDAGQYECRITKNGQTRIAAVDISPYAANEKSHIYIKPENPVEIINFTTPVTTLLHQPLPPPGSRTFDRKKSSTKFLAKFVVFRAALDIYPQPPRSVYWVRNGNRIKTNDEKYNITHLPNNEYSFLRVNDIDGPQEAGIYTLWVETNDKRQSADFELKINVVPTVELYGATDSRAAYVKEARDDYNVVLHTVGAMPHVITCVANGNPTPTIEWHWQECPKDTCNPARRENWHRMTPRAYTITPDYVTSTVVSNLSIAATKATWYQCRAGNSIGSRDDGYMTSDLLSIPSDIVSHKFLNPVDDQFDMHPHDPVEGDDVTLTCRANNILFERIAVEHFAPGIRESRVQRKTFDTEYAYVQSVTINDIGREDGGFYECVLFPVTWLLDSREPKKRRLEMSIEDQTKPYIHRFEPADPVVNAVYNKQQDLQCVARAKPQPHYTWYKDGHELKRTGDDAHRYEDDGQVLVLPRVVEEDSGVYECVARNRVGEAKQDWSIIVTGDPSGSNAMSSQKKHLVALISVCVGIGFLIMLTCLLYACTKWRKEKRLRKRLQHLERLLKTKGDLERLDPTVALSNQAELLEFKEQFEFPREKLRLLEVLLGSGKFGKVVLGEAQGIAAFSIATDGGKKSARAAKNPQLQQKWVRVAVKIARDHGNVEQLKMLMAELKVHMFVGHHLNVVNLLAAVTKNFQLGEMFVILEYCGNGSLKKFLVRHRTELNFMNQVTPNGELKKLDTEVLEAKRQALAVSMLHDDAGAGSQQAVDGTVLTSNDLISFAFQLACGMAYLAGKRVIHRDLAARNVLLTDNLVIKVCDFGLAREGMNNEQDGDAEYSRSLLKEYNNEPLPVKWVAPECVSESKFSTASDVWSYGVTLWEIFALGGDPYPDDKPSREFLDKIFAGYRMQRPAFAPRQMFTIMQLCWDIDPQQRPNFVQLQQLVSKMMNDDELDKYQTMQTQEPYQYMHLMTNPSATNGSEEAWPLIPADAHNGAVQRFIEQTPEDSTEDGYRRGDAEESARRLLPHRASSPPTTSSTVYAGDAHYRPGTSITSLGSSIAQQPTAVIGRRTPGAFTYLPSPTSSTNSRQPYLGTTALMSRFGRNAPAANGATNFKPGGVLETDLDAGADSIEMNSMSRNNFGRDSRRPLLPDNDEGYLNDEFSPAAMSPVFGGAASTTSSFSNANKGRSTSSFAKPGGPSSVSSLSTTTTIPTIVSSNNKIISSPNRR